ncbi:beta-class carbonic anhydrase [Desulfofundulus salinus]|uniref:carbonic anhydrase n=1 Tax=Desulfofundulus salinus TaxID=2419843 RepID=A0A494WR70_9FIRM|nr:carbonic anhydrase [Desulfofundulus salinum]RKO65666.1 carbonic anhydrase [Desulfofundulus salinum]
MIDDLLLANRKFTSKPLPSVSKHPHRRLAILTCMDTRLVDMLEPALGLSRGDAKIIKNAGNLLDEGALRSLVVAIYLLGVEEIIVVGHKDCGMAGLDINVLRQEMIRRGVREEVIAEVGDLAKWVGAFEDEATNVRQVVMQIRNNPLIPQDVQVHGLLMDPDTGYVEVLIKNADL